MLILLNYPKSFHVCNGKISYKLAQNFANMQKSNYYSPDVKPHRNRFARQNNAFIRMMIASSYVTRCTVITKVTSQTTKRNSNQNFHEYLTSPLPSRMPHIAIKCAVQTEQKAVRISARQIPRDWGRLSLLFETYPFEAF